MKFYKNNINDVFAFEPDGSQDHLIAAEMIEISASEADILINPFVLSTSQQIARDRIKKSCNNAIITGIESSVLGISHHYPTELTDQQNLSGLVTETLLSNPPSEFKFWCKDGNGKWSRKAHTSTQIQQLGKAVASHVKTQQTQYEIKLGEIALATSQTELDLVVW